MNNLLIALFLLLGKGFMETADTCFIGLSGWGALEEAASPKVMQNV